MNYDAGWHKCPKGASKSVYNQYKDTYTYLIHFRMAVNFSSIITFTTMILQPELSSEVTTLNKPQKTLWVHKPDMPH